MSEATPAAHDEQMRQLNELMSGGMKPPESVGELRTLLDSFMPFLNSDLPEVGRVDDDVVVRNVDGVKVTADVIAPKGEGPFPVLVYLHGGGWVAGSSKSHRKLAFRFAEAGFLV